MTRRMPFVLVALCAGCTSISIQPSCPNELAVGESGRVAANELNPGEIAIYLWQVFPSDAGTFADPGQPTTTFQAAKTGEVLIRLTASDGLYQVISSCVTSIVEPTGVAVSLTADVTEAAGVGDPGWGTSAAFGDLDGDGDLDLYTVNYLEFDLADPPPRSRYKGIEVLAGPHGLTAQADVLYENLGDGTFRDVTESSGCLAVEPGFGLGVAILDLDGDGKPEIFVGNDSMPNRLFRNRGGLTFEDVGLHSGISSNSDGSDQATMGIAIGDVDGNTRPDVFTTNFSSDTNTLNLNPDGTCFD
ncbi:MAG: VCBS repeat-containing protein, partial [Planctomycetes bacterium]|nr:VCBS repeat-containing protein [Planctomycetota bacterium]